MTKSLLQVLYVLTMIATVVLVDVLFLRDKLWLRLWVNIGIVILFVVFYLLFLKNR